MKKLAFVLVLSFFLFGCKAKTDELETFINDFNESVENTEANEIDTDEVAKHENNQWQSLYNEKGAYFIEVKSNSNGELTNFKIVIDKNQIYYHLLGSGIDASKSVISSLDLDKDKFLIKSAEAIDNLNAEIIKYSENGFEIGVQDITYGEKYRDGLIIMIDKVN
ncbi:hypothetical protein [Paraliobacillus sp. X-1268]|uniref:hypothetical protein n=1 Tax=Paraliobacillus sp. X-1268 TaxID=2213193 RepID=UPI000E3C2F3E|nr:hypothetical protein [Paraliobacillus sp. X-1268]